MSALGRLIDWGHVARGLGLRLALLLTVAILPIGMISILQTLHLSREAERSAEMALLGSTEAAAAGERAIYQTALGTGRTLTQVVLRTMNDPTACSAEMQETVKRGTTYVYAGFTRMDGFSNCNSQGTRMLDLRAGQTYRSFIEHPGTLITSSARALVSQQPIVAVAQPVYREGQVLGYVVVSIPQAMLRSTHAIAPARRGAEVITFSAHGWALSDGNGADPADDLPAGESFASLIDRSDTTFLGRLSNGQRRVFAVVPVVPGQVYALGSWDLDGAGIYGQQLTRFAAVLFPLALWAVSLGVAYFAVYRLVLRHIRELRGQMRRFAIGDRHTPPPVLRGAPAEITDVSQTLHNMARILIRDEAAMEAAVQEKTVLLKEVHHRVKNNLQLIASIINMQSRVIDDADAKRVLRSVQDRVTSLATIYRNLYQAEHLDSVEADRLIAEIIQQMGRAMGAGLSVTTQLAPMTLAPDQAVPLTLLTTEAFTNAVKYAGVADGQTRPWVRVELKREENGRWAQLTVENSVAAQEVDMESTGLGGQLIEAFALQLEGTAELGVESGVFRLHLRFPVRDHSPVPAQGEGDRRVILTSAARAGATH